MSPAFPPTPGRTRDRRARFGTLREAPDCRATGRFARAPAFADAAFFPVAFLGRADFFDAADLFFATAFFFFLADAFAFFARDALRVGMSRV